LLYSLQQRRMLTAAETDTELRLAARLEPAIPGEPPAAPTPTAARVTTAVLLSVLAIKAIRDVFSRSRRE